MQNKIFIVFVIMAASTVGLFAEEGFQLLATIRGESPGDAFSEVCGLGDINQDGYDDFAVGAWEGTNGGNYVKIYFGGSTLDTLADLRLTGGSYFGWSMDSGDFNGDGIPDLMVSAPYTNNFTGQVCIYWGGENIDAEPDIVINGTRWNGFFGEDVANGGDVNGDGYEDFIIGEGTRWETCGYLYIFFGGPAVDDIWDYCIQGAPFDQIGRSCDGIGDINQDGYDDIIVGGLPPSEVKIQRVYIVYGSSILNDSSIIEIVGDSTDAGFGRYVSGIGDIDSDSIPDFLISSKTTDQNHNGIINIYSGSSSEPTYRFIGFNKNGGIQPVCSNIDINKDNINDLLVGYGDGNSLYSGRILCYLGSSKFDTIPDYVLQGNIQHQYFGFSISEIGNFNDDSDTEIIVGQLGRYFYNDSPSELTYGKVFIYSFGTLTKIKEEINHQNFYLKQNCPNPFNANTMIEFALDKAGNVELSVWDIGGRLVRTLERSYLPSGKLRYRFEAQNLPSGIYLLRLCFDGKILQRKMVCLK